MYHIRGLSLTDAITVSMEIWFADNYISTLPSIRAIVSWLAINSYAQMILMVSTGQVVMSCIIMMSVVTILLIYFKERKLSQQMVVQYKPNFRAITIVNLEGCVDNIKVQNSAWRMSMIFMSNLTIVSCLQVSGNVRTRCMKLGRQDAFRLRNKMSVGRTWLMWSSKDASKQLVTGYAHLLLELSMVDIITMMIITNENLAYNSPSLSIAPSLSPEINFIKFSF